MVAYLAAVAEDTRAFDELSGGAPTHSIWYKDKNNIQKGNRADGKGRPLPQCLREEGFWRSHPYVKDSVTSVIMEEYKLRFKSDVYVKEDAAEALSTAPTLHQLKGRRLANWYMPKLSCTLAGAPITPIHALARTCVMHASVETASIPV